MYIAAAEKLGMEVTVVRASDGFGNLTPETQELLSCPRDQRPTAVVCWNDEFAYKFGDYCIDHGLSVPDDVAIVGFDGAHTFPTPRKRLTTVHIPWSDLAMTAVCALVDMRDGKAVPQETLLPVTLQVGDTT